MTDIVVLGPGRPRLRHGSEVVRTVTGEDVDMDKLGGPEPHGRRSGVVHVTTDTDEEAFERSARVGRPARATGGLGDVDAIVDCDLEGLLPDTAHGVPTTCTPSSTACSTAPAELHSQVGAEHRYDAGPPRRSQTGRRQSRTTRCASAVASTRPVAEKAARFRSYVRRIRGPLVVVVDVPGYLRAWDREWDGVVRRGAKFLHAFAGQAVAPRVTLVTRKAYGGAYIAMNSRSLGATRVFAWPGAEVAVMGAVAAVRILHRRRLAEVPEAQRPTLENQLAEEHDKLAGALDKALALGVVDDVVAPTQTRTAIAAALGSARRPAARTATFPL